MTTINPNFYLESVKPNEKKTGNQELGKDEFLKILMSQLQNQDPLKPMEDKEFISQMANFSALEQMTNMSTMMEKFINTMSQDSILKYSEMIGKQINFELKSTDENGNEMVTETGEGHVKSVQQKGLETIIELQDGRIVPSKMITKISEATA